MKKIFLTGAVHADAIVLLEQYAEVVVATDSSPASLKAGMANADAVVVRHPLAPDAFDGADRLRCAIRHGAGIDMIPMDAANRLGVLVANVPGINADYVAEHAIGQMIGLARRLPFISTAFRELSWDAGKSVALGGCGLRGKTVGIVGLGAVGRALANICKEGFAMNIVAAARSSKGSSPECTVERKPLDELLAISDFVALCCPLTPETTGLIDTAALSKMKSSAYLINVARGPVVKEADLIHALVHKRIAGAALDVYGETPLQQSSPLFEVEGLILTPHTAAVTAESMRQMGWESALQVVEILQGRFPKNWVNRSAKAEIEFRWSRLNGVR